MKNLRLTTTFVLSAVCFLLSATPAAASGSASEPATTAKHKSTPEIEAIVQDFEKANLDSFEDVQIPEKYLEPADEAGVRKIKNFAKVNQALNLFITRVNNRKDDGFGECHPKIINRDKLKMDLSTHGRGPDFNLIARRGKLVILKTYTDCEPDFNWHATVLMSPNNTDWYLLPIKEAGWSPKAEVFINAGCDFRVVVSSVHDGSGSWHSPTMFDLQFFINESGAIEFTTAKLIEFPH